MRNQGTEIRKASITVYLALTLCVMVSLISAVIVSAKISAGRMQAENAADQAMFSLFARYDSELEREYGLFFIEAGSSGGSLCLAACIEEMEEAVNYLIQPTGLSFFGGKKLLNLKLEECAITGCTLATDGGGALFREQAEQAVRDTFGIQSISRLKDLMSGADQQKAKGEALIEQSEEESYSGVQKQSEEARKAREDAEAEGNLQDESDNVPENFVNPLPFLEQLQKKAVLDLAAPDGVSAKQADLSKFVSGRTLASGFGVLPAGGEDGSAEMKAFVLKHFSSYRTPSVNAALAYQKEYILCGKSSDLENMKETAHLLMLLREPMNIAGLYQDSSLNALLTKNSSLIASALLVPEAEPVIKILLAAGWSYAESVVDLRAMFMGKRVPLIKNASSWQTGLDQITNLTGNIDSLTRDTAGGLKYDDYLGMLFLKKSENLTMRTMDMVECTIRGNGREDFHLDCCIGVLSAELQFRSEGRASFLKTCRGDYREM